MCGIFCVLIKAKHCKTILEKEFQTFHKYIVNRGPDGCNICWDCIQQLDQPITVLLAASVLWLQGEMITEQPISSKHGILVYNGDIFEGLDKACQEKIGDTKLFFDHIQSIVNGSNKNSIAKELSKLHGPYSFVFLDKKYKKIYFGKDIFGRRSLLLGKNKANESLVVTSVGKRNTDYEFIEIPSIGIFCMDLTGDLFIYKWPDENQNFLSKFDQFQQFIGRKINIVKSAISHKVMSPEGIQQNRTFNVIKKMTPNSDVFETVLNDENWFDNVMKLKCLLEKAVDVRISTQPKLCKKCLKNKENHQECQHATTGVLFSGGVDCAILALLCDKYVEPNRPIDLINVSFDEANQYRSPDRITGLQTVEELQRCCPNRAWNFIEINISGSILEKERKERIADLIYPLNTILDDSLGCALWFASRGQADNYMSPTRVLIVGMGADELFGGYTKHRVALKRSSWHGLQDSLENDWQNLPYRNLGRDDRVVSDHGRQLRTPYLDENVVNFVRTLPCWERTFPAENLPQGIGEKILLRSLAYHLGLKNTSKLKKRALQFGSRIANSKENANEISLRLV